MNAVLKGLVALACCVVIAGGSFWSVNKFFAMRKAEAPGVNLFADGSYSNLDEDDITLLTKAVTRDFFDPDSAKFYAVNYSEKDKIRNKATICGYVNGKNRMGGYIGIQPFFYDREQGTVTMLPVELKDTAADTFLQLVEALGCPRP
ncbi:hypothetical protein [Mesorhizobium kowhaii]|uniref:hypothetical protein n=1 Tax=Mesorhizobium kowhaii TaxID=1300272 RepID=UPI0011B4687C|nr:hypothetical protein [Mesorhizobium kowhaii]